MIKPELGMHNPGKLKLLLSFDDSEATQGQRLLAQAGQREPAGKVRCRSVHGPLRKIIRSRLLLSRNLLFRAGATSAALNCCVV